MFKMKQISSFDDCAKYVHFLGAIGKPKGMPISWYQSDLCRLCDKINFAAGNDTWFHETFKPFHIKYTRKEKLFTVIKKEGISFVESKFFS
jgi:hypothetical protein